MDPNEILQQLMQLLPPSEADAAMRRVQPQSSLQSPTANPLIDAFAKIQAQQAAQLQREQAMAQLKAALQASAAQTKASGPQAQAQLAVTQAKAEPKPDLASLLGISGSGGSVEAPSFPGDTFGGGPGAPITFGTNPRTGEQAFNNFGWVNAPTGGSGRAFDVAQQYSSPEAQAKVTEAQTGSVGETAAKAKALAEIQAWKTAGVTPPKAVSDAWGEVLTGGGAKLGDKAATWYNEFGEPAKSGMTRSAATDAGFAPKTPNQQNAIAAARAVYPLLDKMDELTPILLKTIEPYRRQAKGLGVQYGLGQMSEVQLNRAALALAEKAGDPNIQVFKALQQPLAIGMGRIAGIPGAREGNAMIERMLTEIPGTGSSLESANALTAQARATTENYTGVKPSPSQGPKVAQVQATDKNGRAMVEDPTSKSGWRYAD